MLQAQTAGEMVNQLLQFPQYTSASLANILGVKPQTIDKMQKMESCSLLPAKQLTLIKLFCAKYAR